MEGVGAAHPPPRMSTKKAKRTPVRVARERAGITQFELAVEAGVHPATVSLAERGAPISPTTAAKLAAALGVSPEELQP